MKRLYLQEGDNHETHQTTPRRPRLPLLRAGGVCDAGWSNGVVDMMKNLKGGLTISRPRGNIGSDYIEISVNDVLSGTQCITVRVGLATFAEALTGLGYADCEFDFRPELVGMRRESKEEEIVTKEFLPYAKEGLPRENIAAPLLTPFEVDGWKGRVDDLFNQHRRTKNGYRVTFVRYTAV